MATTTPPTEKEMKDAHALALCQDMEAMAARIGNAEPDPFYGGVPDLYLQTKNALIHHAGKLRERFALGPVPTPVP